MQKIATPRDRLAGSGSMARPAKGGLAAQAWIERRSRVLGCRGACKPVKYQLGRRAVVAGGVKAANPEVGGGGVREAHDGILAPGLGTLLAHGDARSIIDKLAHEHGAQRREGLAVDGLCKSNL